MLSFQAWVPRTVDVALDFFAGGSWAEIENPGWFLVQWPATQRVSWSAPMFPNDGSTLAGCASGAYNAHYVRLAQNMVANGHGDDIVRPGWEFNNNSWFSWRTNGTSTGNANYAACFRHIVTSMRSVAGQSLKFDWSPVNRGLNPEPAYPGDAYVDIIGNDAYDCAGTEMSADQRWQDIRYGQYGIQWQLNFAAAHGKLVSFPEWGVWSGRAECGGDSPYYIARMAELFRELGGRAAYQAYFEFNAPDGAHSLMDGRHPNAAAEYHRQFGT